jgi:hypothetical protein
MPPLQALAALHGIWILVLIPGLVLAWRTWQPSRLRLVGWALIVGGLLGLTVLVGHELHTWYPSVPASGQRYLVQRMLFVIATTTAVPVVQLILAGIAVLIAAWRVSSHHHRGVNGFPDRSATPVSIRK